MAELTILMGRDPGSGQAFIRVAFRSDADATPGEHEDRHRRLLAALFPCGCAAQRERPAREPVVG